MERNNDNELDAGAAQPDMHELLCKVVFGEASAEESARVDAALLESPELQAQKAELEATVSLVRGTMGAASAGEAEGVGLSADRLEAVLEAAAGPAAAADAPEGQVITNTPWHRSPVLRAAAVTLMAAGGLWLVEGRKPNPEGDGGAEAPGGLAAFSKSFGWSTDTEHEAPDEAANEADVKAKFAELESRFPADGSVALNVVDESRRAKESSGVTPLELSLGEFQAPDLPGVFEVVDHASPELHRISLAVGGDANGSAAPAVDPFGGYSGGKAGGTYRGPGDTVPPDASKTAEVWYDEPKEAAPSSKGMVEAVLAKPSKPTAPASGTTVAGQPMAKTRAVPSSPPPTGSATVPPGGGAPNFGLRAFTAPAAPGPATPANGPATPRVSRPVSGGQNSLESLGYAVADQPESGDDDMYLGRGLKSQRKGGESTLHYERGHGVNVHPAHRHRHTIHEPKALPGERPRDMFFRFWGDNPFVISKRDGLSTFAADVDTASFALARRTLSSGHLPRRAQIRTEEFVNFLEPDLACPTEDTFGVNAELSPSPFGGAANRYLLRIGVRAKDVLPAERPPLALTFVVDTSGSMRENNRLELVKHALRLLVDQLDARDTISIVRFSTDASVVLEPTPATAGDVIETALFGLQPDGSTNAEAGLKLGYEMAERTIVDGTQTRVVFLSDGVANVGQTDQDRIASDVEAYSNRNVFLNTIGVGMGNHNDVFLEQLADKGEGVCDYVGDAADARRAIVDRFVGGFVTVAKDVKIQLEFDPKVVLRWRQLGYENRAVRDQDFRNDKVDAGEIGAGHQVTCLYEIEIASDDAKNELPVATARLRWKPVTPGEARAADGAVEEATERAIAFAFAEIAAPSFREASQGFRRSALAAQLAESLRDSIHTAGDPVETLGKELAQLLSEDRHKDTATIAEMTRQAIQLGLKTRPAPALTDADADHLDAYYDALIRSLGGAEPKKAAGIGPESDTETARVDPRERESRIRELLEGNQDGKAH